MITAVIIRPHANGSGWFVFVTVDGGPEICVSGERAIIDMSIASAEVSRWTTRMLLKHEWMP